MKAGFAAVCITVHWHQHSSLMAKLPRSPTPIEIPEAQAANEPPPVVAADVFCLLLYMFSSLFDFSYYVFGSPLV